MLKWRACCGHSRKLDCGARISESVRKHQAGLQSFRSMRRIEASRRNASALRLRFSQSLASKGAFDDPTAWKHHESFRPNGALDDFSFELRQDLRQSLLKVRPLVATIGKELFSKRHLEQ